MIFSVGILYFCRHQLFPHELESAIIETFIDIDKEFLVLFFDIFLMNSYASS
jgi:hypothetical protein